MTSDRPGTDDGTAPAPDFPQEPRDGRRTRLDAALRPVLLLNLVLQVGIVVTGGLVRLTGSGLGCPTWPQCTPGSYTPTVQQAEGYHKYIEFGNRTLTSVLALGAVAAFVVVALLVRQRREHGDRRPARGLLLLAATPLVGVVAQAVLGGITVLAGLSPQTVAAHFLLSAVLICASTALYLTVLAPTAPAERRELRGIAAAVAVVGGIVLVLGTVVTGSGPHSGDADTPARFPFDPRLVSWLHADAVWLFVGLVAAWMIALRLAGGTAAARRRVRWLAAVTLAQGAVGYVQYFTDLPVVLVAVHMLGAALLTVAVTAAVAAVTGLGDPQDARG